MMLTTGLRERGGVRLTLLDPFYRVIRLNIDLDFPFR